MKEKKTDKRVYMEPVCESFAVEAEQLLQAASGNAGMIGPGAGAGDAKQGWFEEEEEEEETASSDESKFGSLWED